MKNFEQFVVGFKDLVFRVAYAYTRNEHDAQDVSQEVFMKAYKHFKELRSSYSLAKRWLYTTTVNASIDHIRRNTTRTQYESKHAQIRSQENSDEEAVPCVMEEIAKLPPEQRQIVYMRYVENFSYAEIAQVLGVTTNWVGEKLHRIRKTIMELVHPKRNFTGETI